MKLFKQSLLILSLGSLGLSLTTVAFAGISREDFQNNLSMYVESDSTFTSDDKRAIHTLINMLTEVHYKSFILNTVGRLTR